MMTKLCHFLQNIRLKERERETRNRERNYSVYRRNQSLDYYTLFLLAERIRMALIATMADTDIDDRDSIWQQIWAQAANYPMIKAGCEVSNTDVDLHDHKSRRCSSSDSHLYDRIRMLGHLEFSDDPTEVPFNAHDWLIQDLITRKVRAPRQNEFLYLLLENPRYTPYLSWLSKPNGVFKIHQPERVATLWRRVKRRQTHGVMDYDTFARGIRYYYKSGIMLKTHKKYTFRFKM